MTARESIESAALLAGRRFQGLLPPELRGQRMDYFGLTLNWEPLAIGGVQILRSRVLQEGSPFLWTHTSRAATTDYPSNLQYIGVQLTIDLVTPDEQTVSYTGGGPAHIENIAGESTTINGVYPPYNYGPAGTSTPGPAGQPFALPMPNLLAPGVAVNIYADNLDAGFAYYLRVQLHGVRFADLGQPAG